MRFPHCLCRLAALLLLLLFQLKRLFRLRLFTAHGCQPLFCCGNVIAGNILRRFLQMLHDLLLGRHGFFLLLQGIRRSLIRRFQTGNVVLQQLPLLFRLRQRRIQQTALALFSLRRTAGVFLFQLFQCSTAVFVCRLQSGQTFLLLFQHSPFPLFLVQPIFQRSQFLLIFPNRHLQLFQQLTDFFCIRRRCHAALFQLLLPLGFQHPAVFLPACRFVFLSFQVLQRTLLGFPRLLELLFRDGIFCADCRMGMLQCAAHRTGLLWFQTACQIACHALKELPFYLVVRRLFPGEIAFFRLLCLLFLLVSNRLCRRILRKHLL